MATLDLVNLTKRFGTVAAVDNVRLTVSDGEFMCILGPSGCGKSTLLRMVAGFEMPTSGDIRIDHESVVALSANKRPTAMVFQKYTLWPHMKVFDNIAFGLQLRKLSRAEIKRKVEESLAMVSLSGYEERYPAQLSGGQQQRVALARAMVKEPKVFLFDEPLSNLDAALRTRMRVEIKRLHLQLKTTSIFVTHDQEEAMILSDYIAVMRDGVVVQYGPAEEVYRRPQHYYVATFIGKPRMGTIEGRLRVSAEGLRFTVGDLQLQWAPTEADGPAQDVPAILGIRAEDVRLHAAGADVAGAFRGRVGLLEPLGSDTFVEVTRDKQALTVRIEPDRRVQIDEAVTLELPRHKLHFFHGETHQRLAV